MTSLKHAIFLCYRRQDTLDATGRLHDALERELPEGIVFRDFGGIAFGKDFRRTIADILRGCQVMLVMIGERWLHATDAEGRRRLDLPDDPVRLEIEQAFAESVHIIPVLVNDAKMPREDELPDSIKNLAFLNAAPLRADADFHPHAARLMKAIKAFMTAETGTAPAPRSRSADVISGSGKWVMLGDDFFESEGFRQTTDGQLIIRIQSHDAATDARISKWSPKVSWQQVSQPCAWQHDAATAEVESIEGESGADGMLWTLALRPEVSRNGASSLHEMNVNLGGQHYSSDDLAELRARRLLLNEALPKRRRARDSFAGHDDLDVYVTGLNTSYPVNGGVFPDLYAKFKGDSQSFMKAARLKAIFALKASGVFEKVLDLRLGPLQHGKMHVYCKGERPQVYSNKEPLTLEIEGDCILGAGLG